MTQKAKFLRTKVFSEEEIKEMKIGIRRRIENFIDPVADPISMPERLLVRTNPPDLPGSPSDSSSDPDLVTNPRNRSVLTSPNTPPSREDGRLNEDELNLEGELANKIAEVDLY